KIRHAYLFGLRESYEGLLDKIDLIEQTIGTHAKLPSAVFYGALMCLSLIEQTGEMGAGPNRESDRHWEAFSVLDDKLRVWAEACPDNLEHKCLLLDAEMARLQHNYGMASGLYDRAIALATVNGYDYEAALGNELAVKLYVSWGKPRVAQEYLFHAHGAYEDWGAVAKVKDLEQRYQAFLAVPDVSASDAGGTWVDAQRLARPSLPLSPSQLQLQPPSSFSSQLLPSPSFSSQPWAQQSLRASNVGQSFQSLDLSSILKASQALSREIQLDKLITILLRLAMENAGANRCALLVPTALFGEASPGMPDAAGDSDESPAVSGWLAKAIAHNYDRFEVVCRDIALADSRVLPLSLVHVIERFLQASTVTEALPEDLPEALIVPNATTHERFKDDIYIVQYQPKSVLCLPVFHQGKLYALLYLENTEAADAFTANHVEVLTLLASQAAISLENARLYEQQERLVKVRTQELTRALKDLRHSQIQLIHKEKMSSLGKMVAGIAHEINNPINFISANIPATSDYIQDLKVLLEAYQREDFTPSDALKLKIDRIEPEFVMEDLADVLRSMEVGANRVSGIVQSLRSFARLDESDLKRVNLHEGLESTLMLLQSRLVGEDGTCLVEVNKHYGVLPQVECFAGQFNQVFFGLLSNAIDAVIEASAQRESFSPCIDIYTQVIEGPVSIQSRKSLSVETQIELEPINIEALEPQTVEPQTVEIRIVDNGVGMSDAVLKKLFDPFFTTKDVGSGTGLGLAIAHQIIVEKHGGQLMVESTPGEGSTFTVRLSSFL
ncbi:MAG: ATP-binding protein, partial [Cyanobacteria bacterium J06598_3]